MSSVVGSKLSPSLSETQNTSNTAINRTAVNTGNNSASVPIPEVIGSAANSSAPPTGSSNNLSHLQLLKNRKVVESGTFHLRKPANTGNTSMTLAQLAQTRVDLL